MAVNKVIYYGEVLVDMSQVSVNPEKLVEGETALDASGELITGNNPYEKTATNTEVDAQSDLLDQALLALQGKSGGSGGAVGSLTKYAKAIATPSSNTSFVIENPLGGIAKKVFVRRLVDTATSSRRCTKFIADNDLGIGVGEYIDTSGRVRYTFTNTSGSVGNSQFKMTEGTITLYRYNSANAWDSSNEYEVEIYQ